MLIVLKKMIKETAVFFLLLVVIAAGFLQSFLAYVGISPELTSQSRLYDGEHRSHEENPSFYDTSIP